MKHKPLVLLLGLLGMSLTSCGQSYRYQPNTYRVGELAITGESFNILQLTDIHLSSKDNESLQYALLDLTINEAKGKGTDLIVITGDTFTFADKAVVSRFCDFIDSHNIPWTITFGNHDEQGLFSVTWLTSFLNDYGKHCLFHDFQDDDVFGNANFFIDVMDGSSFFERLIVMDTNRYYFNDYFGYDYLKQDQIDWYERVVRDSFDKDPSAQSLLFFHIPLPEFQDAYNRYEKHDSSVTYRGGDNKEAVSCPKHNSGMFSKIVDLDSTKGIFVGHDHYNDSAIEYEGVLLSYGTNSTDRIYSLSDKIGGQLISLKKNHSIELERIHHSYSEVEGK